MELLRIFQKLEGIEDRIINIEKNISKLDEKMDFTISLLRNQLIKVKNNEELSDSNILYGRPYNELTPQQALKMYGNENASFIILDVSGSNFNPPIKLNGLIRIPLESLGARYSEVHSKTIPILVISEKGVRSIQACELLVKKGYFNVNNIAGGYQFWGKISNAEATS
jgi:rhodanese-related sulfurtransferase